MQPLHVASYHVWQHEWVTEEARRQQQNTAVEAHCGQHFQTHRPTLTKAQQRRHERLEAIVVTPGGVLVKHPDEDWEALGALANSGLRDVPEVRQWLHRRLFSGNCATLDEWKNSELPNTGVEVSGGVVEMYVLYTSILLRLLHVHNNGNELGHTNHTPLLSALIP
ncbi:hypothetical protein E2C01_024968 [Portunus trituberculatus]|uniref:Uncharacterized protein n=1 Tax=Portunus trituberculatus TaxID=210409 RepID=A0A5B7EC41_PORTR|nr:hypothetical protein [Portunus trituberculatus]